MKKTIMAGVISALLSTSALAHTNSIGYVGDGNGGLNFYYGSWHDGTQFNEAELKIIRPDGTTSIDAFNLLEQDSPAGLLSGINFFTSDGTQLVPYDPNTPHPMGMPNESYTWQGVNYQNLATGQYTFVYIPLGDAESNLPGSPTAEWMPMDEVIRSLTIQLTQGDLNGDANLNGILDINEVASGAASGGPTVVSQGSSQVVGYIAVSGGVIQVVSRTQTDTTWDNMSDGTTANVQVTNTALTPLKGRIDQVATAQDVVSSTLRNLNFDNIQGIRMNSTYNNGMSGNTGGIVIGGSKTTDNGLTINGGFTRLDTSLAGNDDTVKANTDVVAVGVEKNNVAVEFRRATTDYTVSRTIGDFANDSATKGTDTSLSLTYSPNTGKVQPVIGYTRGNRTVDGYVENGSVQTARTVASTDDMYGYGTIGLRGDLGLVDFTAMHHTDGVNDVSIGLEKETDKVTWRVEATRSMTDLGNTTSVSAGIEIKF
jgi:hypothetical protein